MCAPQAILTWLESRGVTLYPNGDKLRLYPVGNLDDFEVRYVKAHKRSLLAHLKATGDYPEAKVEAVTEYAIVEATRIIRSGCDG